MTLWPFTPLSWGIQWSTSGLMRGLDIEACIEISSTSGLFKDYFSQLCQ